MIKKDIEYMRLALNEAIKGEGRVNPNPLVGAVVVKNDKIISTGYHEKYGEAHAERNALNKIGELAEGATLYVTLEPCSHTGKTPPCVDKIIESKIKRCVVATLDSNPLVSGKGIKKLKDAGIEVQVGILEKEALEINSVFFKYVEEKLPFIFLKCGITLDGKIATKDFSSKWITNSLAREKVQMYRNKFMGIMLGKNSVLHDNPTLDCRMEGGRNPVRIIIDSKLDIPYEYKVISNNEDEKTIIVTSKQMVETQKYSILKEKHKIKFITLLENEFQLKDIFKQVGKLGIDSILVEGGSSVISQLFRDNLIDAGEIFIAPKILGDSTSIPFVDGFSRSLISEAIELKNVKYNIYGDNIGLEFKK
ncbi:MAG: bifunctional diaminohydroxyphosphoribosylaminopyrimidine deaminase/5-amino-6-(5-phosphoribosylamino)uracil reductase RibD [Cetobacterium sp.]